MNTLYSLQTLFVGRRFEIPDYQRGYAWAEKQWDDLLDDIETLPHGKDHFTGMIVLKPGDAPPVIDIEGTQYSRFDVVDGQQRLTTLVLLLEAIRRSLVNTGIHGLADGIRRSYVSFVDRNEQPVYRLRLNDGSQQFFETVVLADHPAPTGPTTNSQRLLLDARQHFAAFLGKRQTDSPETHSAWLETLHDKVAHHLKTNLYIVEDAAEVGVIFEVMNNRGKPLSELDLVKNYLLYVGTKLDLQEHFLHSDVVEAWGRVFRDLMSAGLTDTSHEDQLLRAHWLLAYDHQRKNWDGARSVKTRLSLKRYQERHEDLLADLKSYAATLSHAAVAYCDINRPTRPNSFADFEGEARLDVIRRSDAFVRVNAIAGFIPLLVATRLACPGDAFTYAGVLRLCEAFAFRVFRLMRWRSHTGQSTLFRLANQLYANEIDRDELLASLRGTLHYYNSERQFAGAFSLPTEGQSDWYSWPGLKYFLFEYERYLSGDDDVWVKWAEVEKAAREKTIEHVLPQTPTGEWLKVFDAEERRLFTHDLGNLSLTSDNASYSNKPFAQKKGSPGDAEPCYANSPYKMERALAQYDSWNPDAILQRRQKMIDWAIIRWGVEPADEAVEIAPDDFEADVDADEARHVAV